MSKVQVFDPPMCCSTGVCGPEVDPALVREIAPFAWVVNQSLAPVVTRDPLLAARRALEAPYLAEVRSLSRRMAVVALAAEPPQGAERLLGLVASAR